MPSGAVPAAGEGVASGGSGGVDGLAVLAVLGRFDVEVADDLDGLMLTVMTQAAASIWGMARAVSSPHRSPV